MALIESANFPLKPCKPGFPPLHCSHYSYLSCWYRILHWVPNTQPKAPKSFHSLPKNMIRSVTAIPDSWNQFVFFRVSIAATKYHDQKAS